MNDKEKPNMNEPKIRFQGFWGEWEKVKYSDFAEIHRGLTYSPDCIIKKGVRVLRSSNIDEDTFVISDDDVFVMPNCINVSYAKDGDILVTAANGSPRLVGKHAIIKNSDNAPLVAGGFMFLVTSKETEFLNASMSSDWYWKFLKTGVAGGNGSIGNLNRNELGVSQLFIPKTKRERDLIASFFSNLDLLIQSAAKKIDSLEQVKNASLQAMFPKEGETVPQIRFKGFTDEWKKVKLGEITTSYSGGTPTAGYAEYYGGDIPFIRSGEIHKDKTELYLTTTGFNSSSAKMVEKGTLLYALYGATSGDIAISRIKGAINQAILAIIPTKDVESAFLAQFLQANKIAIVSELLQGGQGNLSGALVKGIDVLFPSSQEQTLLIDFFTNLDSQIALQSRRLEKLKQIKSACLNDMFV